MGLDSYAAIRFPGMPGNRGYLPAHSLWSSLTHSLGPGGISLGDGFCSCHFISHSGRFLSLEWVPGSGGGFLGVSACHSGSPFWECHGISVSLECSLLHGGYLLYFIPLEFSGGCLPACTWNSGTISCWVCCHQIACWSGWNFLQCLP